MSKLLDAMTLLQMRPMDLWKSLDVDHDNRVTKTELKAGLQRLGCAALADADIDHLIMLFDADGARKAVSIHEWKAVVTASYHERHHQQRVEHTASVEAKKAKAEEEHASAASHRVHSNLHSGLHSNGPKRELKFRYDYSIPNPPLTQHAHFAWHAHFA
jgi:hypothetical protein